MQQTKTQGLDAKQCGEVRTCAFCDRSHTPVQGSVSMPEGASCRGDQSAEKTRGSELN